MSLPVKFSREALADIDELDRYLRDHNPYAVVKVMAALEDRISVAADFPASGRLTHRNGIRELVEPRFGYLIPYIELKKSIYVLRVYRAVR